MFDGPFEHGNGNQGELREAAPRGRVAKSHKYAASLPVKEAKPRKKKG